MDALELLATQAAARTPAWTPAHALQSQPVHSHTPQTPLLYNYTENNGYSATSLPYRQPIVPAQYYQLPPTPAETPNDVGHFALSQNCIQHYSEPLGNKPYSPILPQDNMISFRIHDTPVSEKDKPGSDAWWRLQDKFFNYKSLSSEKENTQGPKSPSKAQGPKSPPKAEQKAKKKLDSKPKAAVAEKGKWKRGTGSKSGSTNHREGGDSDVEIELLTPEDVKAAALKDPEDEKKAGVSEEDKVTLVKYLTMAERWKNFKLRQGALMAASDIFKGFYSPTQLTNAWKTIRDKYKAVRECQEHTGGGDGDADCDDEKRRKRATKRGKRKYSNKVLNAFEASEIFELLDKVAHNDSSVVHGHNMNSTSWLSDSSDEEDEKPKKKKAKLMKHESSDDDNENRARGKLLADAVGATRDKAKAAEDIERKKYELALKRDKREEEAKAEELRLAVANQRNVKWLRAEKMMASPIKAI
ncbi:hypothetical protein BT96DRAFT_995790 [Gymnopus androsaceus JB14]|uniref:No apical meristem-associated C-terminal domain-containing protein n=1 Tax=Gymnopus androsaceus JB14 TaxID=1447944 RepID=A0A6A4HIE7_9AGAR|nr:hypothetical protein BT96DRAFT_995790 [Gymnopus androsaceus JB14]